MCLILEDSERRHFLMFFRKYASFIVSNDFTDVNSPNLLLSFYRLIGSLYFTRHCSAFLPYVSPEALFASISEEDELKKHVSFLTEIREKQWERVVSEVEMMPNPEALKLHWKRCCWVYSYWKQSIQNNISFGLLTDFGWDIANNKLSFVWDLDINFQKVEKTVQWYTKGCGCKTGCLTNRCKCRKNTEGFCGPGCKCINCKNVSLMKEQCFDSSDIEADLEDNIDELSDDEVIVEQIDNQNEGEQVDDDYWLYVEGDV